MNRAILKNYLLATVCIIFAGCSVKQKISNAGIDSNSIEDVSEPNQNAANVPTQKRSEETPKRKALDSTPVSQTTSQLLNEAIKGQKDQDIYKYAGQALLENPSDVKALNAMALYQYKKGRFSAAVYLLDKALAQNPNSAEVHSNLEIGRASCRERVCLAV